MTLYIFPLLLLLTSLNGAQNNVRDIKPLLHPLAQYHHFTNLAARAIYSNDFAAASIAYDSAFHYRQYPYYIDLKNYILVNHKAGHYEKNKSAILQLLTVKQIDTAQLFREIPKRVFSEENLSLISRLATMQRKERVKETAYQQALRAIWATDQGIRDYDHIQQKDKAAQNAIYASRDSVDIANFINFEKLCARYGFPSEETVGVFFNEEWEWAYVAHILLLHFRQSDDEATSSRATAIIQQAMQSGMMHPALGAELLDRQPSGAHGQPPAFNYLSTTVYLVIDKAYQPFVFYSDSLMNTINTNRLAIGLDSFHITQKQVVCQHFGSESVGDTSFIMMVPYANIGELPPGLVQRSAREAKVDLADYKINTAKIIIECRCEEKAY